MRELISDLKGYSSYQSYISPEIRAISPPQLLLQNVHLNIREDFPYVPIELVPRIFIKEYTSRSFDDIIPIMEKVFELGSASRYYYTRLFSAWSYILRDGGMLSKNKEILSHNFKTICNSPLSNSLGDISFYYYRTSNTLTPYKYKYAGNLRGEVCTERGGNLSNIYSISRNGLLTIGTYVGRINVVNPIIDDSFGVKQLLEQNGNVAQLFHISSTPLLFLGVARKDIPKYRKAMLLNKEKLSDYPELKFIVDKKLLDRPSSSLATKGIYNKMILPASNKFEIPIELVDVEKDVADNSLYGYNKEVCAALMKKNGTKLLKLYTGRF